MKFLMIDLPGEDADEWDVHPPDHTQNYYALCECQGDNESIGYYRFRMPGEAAYSTVVRVDDIYNWSDGAMPGLREHWKKCTSKRQPSHTIDSPEYFCEVASQYPAGTRLRRLDEQWFVVGQEKPVIKIPSFGERFDFFLRTPEDVEEELVGLLV